MAWYYVKCGLCVARRGGDQVKPTFRLDLTDQQPAIEARRRRKRGSVWIDFFSRPDYVASCDNGHSWHAPGHKQSLLVDRIVGAAIDGLKVGAPWGLIKPSRWMIGPIPDDISEEDVNAWCDDQPLRYATKPAVVRSWRQPIYGEEP